MPLGTTLGITSDDFVRFVLTAAFVIVTINWDRLTVVITTLVDTGVALCFGTTAASLGAISFCKNHLNICGSACVVFTCESELIKGCIGEFGAEGCFGDYLTSDTLVIGVWSGVPFQ